MPKKNGKKFSFTVCGEFFPEVYPAFRSLRWSRGEEDPLATEMRLFCACHRWAFKRLLEGVSRDEVKKLGQELFGLNSRYVDDARLKAQSTIDSQRELLKLEIEETEKKLKRARKKLGFAVKKLKRAEEKGLPEDELRKLALAVKGRENRVSSLEKKLRELREHKENGTIPKVIFGGKKLWRRVCKGKASREEWRAARKNRLYSRGDREKGGNPNTKLSHDGQEFRLSIAISHLSEQVGVDKLGRPKVSRAPKVEGRLWLPEKHRTRVLELLATKQPYTVEIIRTKEGRYLVYITFELESPPEPDFSQGCLAVDTNPDGVGIASVSRLGLPEPWPEGFEVPCPKNLGKFEEEFQVITHPSGFMYIKVPELEYASGFRRRYLIGVLAKVVVDVAKALGKPVVLEELDFNKGRLDTCKGFNRMASNFPHAAIRIALVRRAVKEKVGYKQVLPRHTSTIGRLKYAKKYGVPVHCAAALVIGRRAMGFKEKITREIKEFVLRVKQRLTSGASLPGKEEG
nr:transposase [Ammonifex thiophilus]